MRLFHCELLCTMQFTAWNNTSILLLSIWLHCLSKHRNLLKRNICAAKNRKGRQLVFFQWSHSKSSSWMHWKHVSVNNERRNIVLHCVTTFYLLMLENTCRGGILDKALLPKALWIQYVHSFSWQVDAKTAAETKLIGVPMPWISQHIPVPLICLFVLLNF